MKPPNVLYVHRLFLQRLLLVVVALAVVYAVVSAAGATWLYQVHLLLALAYLLWSCVTDGQLAWVMFGGAMFCAAMLAQQPDVLSGVVAALAAAILALATCWSRAVTRAVPATAELVTARGDRYPLVILPDQRARPPVFWWQPASWVVLVNGPSVLLDDGYVVELDPRPTRWCPAPVKEFTHEYADGRLYFTGLRAAEDER